MPPPFLIEYSPDVADHLRSLTARQRSTLFDSIKKRLEYEPTVETRNRKPMRPNPMAPWELRVGNLRVYYDVDEEDRKVLILAVGIKVRNRVRIGRQEIEL